MRFVSAMSGALALGTFVSASIAPPKRPVLTKRSSGDSVGSPLAFNFTMPIDHFNDADTRTYQNEYWVNDTFYQPGSPIFLWDLGETGSTSDDVAYRISYDNSVYSLLLQRFNGLGIAWQHRFYGYSLPFPVDDNGVPEGGVEAFKYLTQEQAMEDVVYFANNMESVQEKLNIEGDDILHPDNTPWIMIGGSYPAMRAAMIRVRNPDVIYASWASSAPLQPDADGSAYFNAALRGLYTNCTNDYHMLVKWMDQAFDDNDSDTIRYIQERLWLGDALSRNVSLELNKTAAHALSFSDMGSFMQNALELGNFQDDGPAGVRSFCDRMEMYDPHLASRSASTSNYDPELDETLEARSDGLFGLYGGEPTLDAFLFGYVWTQNPYWQNMLPSHDEDSGFGDTGSDASGIQVWGNIAYAWQTLYELGNFLGWSPDYEKFHPTDSVLSKYYTWQDARMNMINSIPGLDPEDVGPVTSYWVEYGGWAMQPSNVMFSDGYWDPWRAFSPGSEEYEMGKPVRNYTQEMPACGFPLDGDKIYGTMYTSDDSAHCSDLNGPDSPQSSHSLELFMHALSVWLPCFYNSS